MKIRYIYFGQDLRKNHNGLMAVLKNDELALQKGEFCLFLNSKQNIFKMISSDTKVIIMYKDPTNSRINPRIIKNLHKYWNGSEIDMKKAVHEELTNQLKARKRKYK